jgi:hypothetical protein
MNKYTMRVVVFCRDFGREWGVCVVFGGFPVSGSTGFVEGSFRVRWRVVQGSLMGRLGYLLEEMSLFCADTRDRSVKFTFLADFGCCQDSLAAVS